MIDASPLDPGLPVAEDHPDSTSVLSEEDTRLRKLCVQLLRRGVNYFNEWRIENPSKLPNFQDFDFRRIKDLDRVSFIRLNLRGARFDDPEMSLWMAQFGGADLCGTIFDGADLQGASFYGAKVNETTTFVGAKLDSVEGLHQLCLTSSRIPLGIPERRRSRAWILPPERLDHVSSR